MRWIPAILIVATAALCVLRRDLWTVAALPLVLACLVAVWQCERRLPAGRSPGVSTAAFGVAANVAGAGLNIPLAVLPYGSTFDSLGGPFGFFTLQTGFFGLVVVIGVALSLRALVRARSSWKLLAPAGLVLSLTPVLVSHHVYLWVVEARGLHDLW